MRRIIRAIVLLLFAGVLAVITLLSIEIGTNLDGHRAISTQCSMSAALPVRGGPYFESTVVTGRQTYLPLGVVCTYDAPGDGIGPQAVVRVSWLWTGVALVAGAVAIWCFVLVVRPRTARAAVRSAA
ncbi:hypothetical protein BH09ACT1_BH09ACT1_10470 [soil metagenome]